MIMLTPPSLDQHDWECSFDSQYALQQHIFRSFAIDVFHPRPCRRLIQSHGLFRLMIGDASSLLLCLFFAFFRLFIISLDMIAFAKHPWRLYSVSWCPWTVTAIIDPVPRILSLLPPRPWQFSPLFSDLELQVVWLPNAFFLQLDGRANCTWHSFRLHLDKFALSCTMQRPEMRPSERNEARVWRDMLAEQVFGAKSRRWSDNSLTLNGVI